MKKVFKILGGTTFVVALAFNFNTSEARENDDDGEDGKYWKTAVELCYDSTTREIIGYGSYCIPGADYCTATPCY